MLKTETNTLDMESQIRKAAYEALSIRGGQLQSDFEHGQWWITNQESGAQWSVVDAEGGLSVDGFDFEQVTEGDES